MLGMQTGTSLCLHFPDWKGKKTFPARSFLHRRTGIWYTDFRKMAYLQAVVTTFDCTFLLLIEDNSLYWSGHFEEAY